MENELKLVMKDKKVVLAKKDRAQLNTFCTALNNERIRIGKIYSAPYDKFKKEVDEVIAEIKGVVGEIDSQVKKFEEEKQEKKQREIIEYFESIIGDLKLFVPYEKIHDAKWLNASMSIKAVKTEIDNRIGDVRNAITAIEAMKSDDEAQIKAFYFRTLSLSNAIAEYEALKAERAFIDTKKAEEIKEIKNEEKAEVVKIEDAPKQVVKFAVTATVEQLKLLQKFLIENDIQYNAI